MVKKGSTVISDSCSGYHSVKDSYTHEVVQHSLGIYVNKKGFHTNSIGGFRGHLKRMITGVYYVMSPKHLPKYCKESAFRYSTYKISDGERLSYSYSNQRNACTMESCWWNQNRRGNKMENNYISSLWYCLWDVCLFPPFSFTFYTN